MKNIENMVQHVTDVEEINYENRGEEKMLQYETKFLPQEDIKEINMNIYEQGFENSMPSLYAKNGNKNSLNFDDFIAKGDGSFNSVFSAKNVDDFFANVPDFYNPLRDAATKITTDADSISVPSIGQIQTGENNKNSDVHSEVVESVLIKHAHLYAKMEMPFSFLNTVENKEEYIKPRLAMKLSKLERTEFLDGNGQENNILGIFKDRKLNIRDVDYIAANVSDFVDKLLDWTFNLSSEYKHEACFMLSSNMQKILAKIKDTTGRYIFDNKTLFGYDVYTLDELANSGESSNASASASASAATTTTTAQKKDRILFGNFKYGYVVSDKKKLELKVYDMFDRPSSRGLVLSNTCGAAIVCADAIMALNVTIK